MTWDIYMCTIRYLKKKKKMNANLIQIKVKHDKTLNYNCLDKKKKMFEYRLAHFEKKNSFTIFFEVGLNRRTLT